MLVLFWVSVIVVAYVYVGYPLALKAYCGLRSAECGMNPSINPHSAIRTPQSSVSIVIAARNEGGRLPTRLDNLLSLDYPAENREIVVVSDGSSDDTLDVLARYSRDVVAVARPPSGKALALNAGVARATGDIIVFADARQVFAADALRELTAPFADPLVGAVSGELLLDAESPCRRAGGDRRSFHVETTELADKISSALSASSAQQTVERRRGVERRRTIRSTIADGVGLYWKYEKQLRRLESAVDSTLGVTGAIYAMRRSLYAPLPADTILDDVLTPMRVVLRGYRVVFNERAKAFDRAAADADAEARRKVRTLAGNYQILALEPRLLAPWANRVWVQYVSHKLGRLAVPYALLAIFGASVVLATSSVMYAAVLVAQVLFFLMAGLGALFEMSGRRQDAAQVANPEPGTRNRVPASEVA
jgi:cellulose synthase/poly-beta-1,6-N-acetylglucosamine synthase-like glycosyltransferase